MDEENKVLEVSSLADVANHVGETFGPGPWMTVDQAMINAFGEASGDDAWFHTDPERAKTAMPDGKTIAQGLLTLAVTVKLLRGVMKNSSRGAAGGGSGGAARGSGALNYGYDRVRFLAPVQVGSRLRMRGEVASAEPRPGGMLIRFRLTVELEGSEKPAMVGEWMELAFT